MAVLRFTSLIKIRDPNPYILVTTAQAKSIKPNWRKPLPVERSVPQVLRVPALAPTFFR